MKVFTFVDFYDYIIFLPPLFDWITEEHIDAFNRDTNKSFIIKKKVRGILDIEWKGEKNKIVEDAQVTECEDTDIHTVPSKQKKKFKRKHINKQNDIN